MTNFSIQNNSNISFGRIKIPKINWPKPQLLHQSKTLDSIADDTFQRTLQIPESIIKDRIDEKTFNNARNFVMKSINGANPKEGIVIINNGKIVASKVCSAHFGSISGDKILRLAKNPKNNISVIHSHPKTSYGNTMPISYGDFETLNKYPGLKTMYAIDANGNYSLLRKTRKEKISDSAVKNMLKNQYLSGYVNWMNKIDDPDCENLVDLYKYLKFEFNGTEKQKLELLDEFSKLQESIDDAGYAAGYIDSFWKKYADKLGVFYETNFLNLN